MKREFSPLYLALFLILGCVVFRLLGSLYPHLLPNISPMMAVAFVGAMYLPRAWGWLVGPVAILVTEVAFIPLNKAAGSAMFSWDALVYLAFFAAVGGFGILIAKHKTLPRILGGSLLCSLLFYVIGNTMAWATLNDPCYAQNFAGWIQANTVGLPGWQPTWTFLRNGALGDLFFAVVLLAILDRALIFGHATAKSAPHLA